MRNYTGTSEQLGDHYYMMEELHSVAALVAPNGRREESYVYDTYGQAAIWRAPKGDVSGDGLVDSWDEDLLDGLFGYISENPPTSHAHADFDMDGDVDDQDEAVVTANLGAEPVELASSELGNPYLFTGRPTDTLGEFASAGGTEFRRIQDNRNRAYDPKHGRWLQRDPLGYVDGLNVYQYSKSAPTIMVDAWGRKAHNSTGYGASQARPPTTCGGTVPVTINGATVPVPCQTICEPAPPEGNLPCGESAFKRGEKTGCSQRVRQMMESDPLYKDIVDARDRLIRSGDAKAASRCDPQIICACCSGECSYFGGAFVRPGESPDTNQVTGWPTLAGSILICEGKSDNQDAIRHELVHAKSWCLKGKSSLGCSELLKEEMQAYLAQGVDCGRAVMGAIMSSCMAEACAADDIRQNNGLLEELYRECRRASGR
jgi:RHS repeat-associated protein